MSQELIDSVTALTEETTQLLEVYTQESLTLNTKVTNAADSAAAAKASEEASASSEANSANSEALALQYKNEAEILTQLTTWQQYKADAELAAINASASEQASKVSETNSLASEQASKISEVNSLASEQASKQSELNSAASAEASKVSETNSLASENASKNSELASLASEQASKISETNSLASEQASKQSELNSAASELATKTSETNAANSASLADTHQQTTLGYRNESEQFSLDAEASNQSAAAHEATTLGYKNAAAQSATDSEASNQSSASHDASASQHRVDAQAAATSAANSESNVSQSEANVIALEANVTTMESNVTAIEQTVEQYKVDSAASSASAKVDADRAASAVGDVTWKQFARKDAEMEQMRRQNLDARAASGFDHYGKSRSATGIVPVNEGLYTHEASSNVLHIGHASASKQGTSITDYPITCIAGFVSKLLYINYDKAHSWQSGNVKFAPAERGTKVFDSTGDVRGSGKAQLDLLVDADPKYVNSAEDLYGVGTNEAVNEAVSRAFEGGAPNGDFRLGDDGSWLVGDSSRGSMSIADGRMTITDTTGINTVGLSAMYVRSPSILYPAGTTVKVEVVVDSITDGCNAWVRIDRYPTSVDEPLKVGSNQFTVTLTTGIDPYIYIGNNGTIVVRSVSVKSVTEEVVINPVDMFGMESWLEIVSEAKPYVYACGDIQAQAAEMNGITTVRSNRPDTYYSVYDGDLTSTGLGVDFWSAATEQKIAMLNDVDNNLFLIKDAYGVDTLVQWRNRQRTVRGAGNGEWLYTNSTTDGALAFTSNQRVKPQGYQDSVVSLDVGSPNDYLGNLHGSAITKELGVFEANAAEAENYGVFGHCYYHTWGVVSRLNPGAYHPSFNPLGTAKFAYSSGGTAAGSRYWTEVTVSAVKPLSTLDCFAPFIAFGAVFDSGAQIARYENSLGKTGTIANGYSGHPDDLFHDAICSSGQGGVIDYRMPSWCMGSPETASLVFQKLVAGIYRGKEYLPYTAVKTIAAGDTIQRTSAYFSIPKAHFNYKSTEVKKIHLFTDGATYSYDVINVTQRSDTEWNVYCLQTVSAYINSATALVVTYDTDIPVSGNFHQTDVIGVPTVISAIPHLANGWIGGFSPTIPDGTSLAKHLARKEVLSSAPTYAFTDNLGDSWTTGTFSAYSSTTNTVTTSDPATRVLVINYTAFAKQTKQSANKPVLNGDAGIGYLETIANYNVSRGNLLAETLLDKVVVGTSLAQQQGLRLKSYRLVPDTGALATSVPPVVHEPLSIPAGADGSSGVKVLWHQIADNQLCSLNLIWNELIYTAYSSSDITLINDQTAVTASQYETVRFNDPTGTLFGTIATRQGGVLSGSNLSGQCALYDGNIVSSAGEHYGITYWAPFDGNGWFDHPTMKIVSGLSTYLNLKGKSCLYGTDELAIPYGFVKNQARPSLQVAGVDL